MPREAPSRRARHLAVGRAGERAAAEHLTAHGYQILERNYRTRRAEIDLVARRGDVLVFVEVRSRCGEAFSLPEETLTARKLRRLQRHAVAYATWRRWPGPCRIDAICVVLAPRPLGLGLRVTRLTHHENITA